MIKSIKRINLRMFSALVLLGLIPTLYLTFRIYLIGQMPGTYNFSIAGQLQWVGLLYEIVQEAIILPLFFFIGAVVSNKKELVNRIKTGLVITLSIYGALSLILIIFAKPIVILMAQDQNIIKETVQYIRLESIAMIFQTLVRFLMVVLITIKKDKNIYILLIFQLVITVILDIFLVSMLPISLKLGVNGIAISNIIVNMTLLVMLIYVLKKNNLKIVNKEKSSYKWVKNLFKKGGVSGLESLVRNLAFMFMIVRMINVVGEQGTFWIANNFIWAWLLLPVLQLGELIKADCGEEGYQAVESKSIGYFAITSIIVVLWILTIPLWNVFLKNILQVPEPRKVLTVIYISLGFYILFAFNNVIDSIFYGLGKTSYMLFQSLVINIFFYGTVYILYLLGIYKPTLNLIALMFALGTGLDSLLTMAMYYWMVKTKKLVILT